MTNTIDTAQDATPSEGTDGTSTATDSTCLSTSVHVRMLKSHVDRADALVGRIEQRFPGMTADRAKVVRMALLKGLEALELEFKELEGLEKPRT